MFRVSRSSLDVYIAVLDGEWAVDCRNGAELWRGLRDQDFQGFLRAVAEWTTRRRRAEQMQAQGQKAPSAGNLVWLISFGCDHLTKADTVIVDAVEAGVFSFADVWKMINGSRA